MTKLVSLIAKLKETKIKHTPSFTLVFSSYNSLDLNNVYVYR